MGRIWELPPEIVEKIAAGEVVERPASVVKELVENSIDAGAGRIEIAVEKGGMELIKVSDDGCGMTREDLEIAVKRHTTSKIRSLEDIFAIRTLGFRGEALPSIGAVSRMEIVTRAGEEMSGWRALIEGGKLLRIEEAGRACGTTVAVRELFFKTPARKKFLKSQRAELGKILALFQAQALARYDIGFTLESDGEIAYSLPPARDLRTRVGGLFGWGILEELIPFEYEGRNLRVWGFAGKPSVFRGSRRYQYLFVNGRWVEGKILAQAGDEAYRGRLMKGRYPVLFVFLEIEPSFVDVNVHPSKREVKFSDEEEVRGAIVEAIREALEGEMQAVFEGVGLGKKQEEVQVEEERSQKGNQQEQEGEREEEEQLLLLEKEEGEGEPLLLLGQIENTYILLQGEEGIIIFDQHALHERILYEEIKKKGEGMEIQQLVLPVVVEISGEEFEALHDKLEYLAELGIEIEEFGKNTIALQALPKICARVAPEQFLREVIDDILQLGKLEEVDRLREELMHIIACRAAVKAGDRLKREEMEELVRKIPSLDNPYTCPHGRPTAIKLDKAFLEKIFGRRG